MKKTRIKKMKAGMEEGSRCIKLDQGKKKIKRRENDVIWRQIFQILSLNSKNGVIIV